MNMGMRRLILSGLVCLGLTVGSSLRGGVLASQEQAFPVLKIGTHTYRNVTVTTKSKSYVFLLHSEGMTNVKVSDLPAETLKELGYADPAPAQTNAASSWAKQTLAKLETPQIKGMQEQLKSRLATVVPKATNLNLPPFNGTVLAVAGVVLLGIYLFFCYCSALICQKAGRKPGALIWIPVLQWLPLFKAARMSGWWFVAFFVPVLNLVAQVLWCFKIADARNKNALVGILLLLPITSLFAFLYLAFSDGARPDREESPRRVEIMTLETA
jgi:uncharacterized protein DUF5684